MQIKIKVSRNPKTNREVKKPTGDNDKTIIPIQPKVQQGRKPRKADTSGGNGFLVDKILAVVEKKKK